MSSRRSSAGVARPGVESGAALHSHTPHAAYAGYAAQYDETHHHPDAAGDGDDGDERPDGFDDDDDLEPPASLMFDGNGTAGGARGVGAGAVGGGRSQARDAYPRKQSLDARTGILHAPAPYAPDSAVAPSSTLRSTRPLSLNAQHTPYAQHPPRNSQQQRQQSIFEYIFAKDSSLRHLLAGPRANTRPRHPAPASNEPALAHAPSPGRYDTNGFGGGGVNAVNGVGGAYGGMGGVAGGVGGMNGSGGIGGAVWDGDRGAGAYRRDGYSGLDGMADGRTSRDGYSYGARGGTTSVYNHNHAPDPDDDTTPLLHSSSPSYYTHPPSHPLPPPPGRGRLPPRDAALGLWSSIRTSAQLDKFLQRMYAYYVGRGLWCVVLDRVVGVLTASFVILFPTFLIRCIDFSLSTSPNLPSIIVPTCPDILLNPFSSLPNLFFFVWAIFELSRLVYDLPGLARMRGFFTFAIEVPEADLWSVGWSFIVSRVCGGWLGGVRLSQPPSSPNAEHSPADVPLHALTIANRILRKENYLVGLLGGTGVDPDAPDDDDTGADVMTLALRNAFADPGLPFLPKVVFKGMFGTPPVRDPRSQTQAPGLEQAQGQQPQDVYLFPLTRSLEWTFSYCVLECMFEDNGEIRKGVRIGPGADSVYQNGSGGPAGAGGVGGGTPKAFLRRMERVADDVGLGAVSRAGSRRAIVNALQRRFRMMAVLNLLFAPFVLVFMVLYFFFENAEEYYKNPAALGTRTWTPLARWKFRTFNELSHYFTTRINRSHPLALAYLGDFPNWHNVIIARFVAFISGAVAAVLTIASIIDEDLLLRFEITKGHSAVFYIGVFAAVFAVARSMVPDEHVVYDPRMHLTRLAKFTYYMPKRWIGNFHSEAVRREVEALFDAKISLWFREVCALISTPAILWYALGREDTVEAIVTFFERNAKWVDGVGWVCKYAWWEEEVPSVDQEVGGQRTPVEQDLDMEHTIGPSPASPERVPGVRVLDFTDGQPQAYVERDFLAPYEDRDRDRDGNVELDILPQDDKMMKSFMQFRQNHPSWDNTRPGAVGAGAGLSRSVMYLGQHLGIPGGPARVINLAESTAIAPEMGQGRRVMAGMQSPYQSQYTGIRPTQSSLPMDLDEDGSTQFFTPTGESFLGNPAGDVPSPYRSVADVSRWGAAGARNRPQVGNDRRGSNASRDQFQRIASPEMPRSAVSPPPPRPSTTSPPPRVLDFTSVEGVVPAPRARALSPTDVRPGTAMSGDSRSGAMSPTGSRRGPMSPAGSRPRLPGVGGTGGTGAAF
ncbi:APG9-domain-containing protein [Gonapodya prolifera JEL478]|uniref:Autophagy-related protein 9 n=1 Tax=Gonapodya prolifera (strain JEL478) TaxID=1344416 RepID=A0A139ATP9_GONPJ|nr:APG9-domain-containing protein [Gonapodya prolifera JEL478]|eukprot:KXS20089.1 APG9-domain-containing protein [Gonapodya prolifera JEL478]